MSGALRLGAPLALLVLSGCATQRTPLDATDPAAVAQAWSQVPVGRVTLVPWRGSSVAAEHVELRADSVFFDEGGRRKAMPVRDLQAVQWSDPPSPVVYAGMAATVAGGLLFSGIGISNDEGGGGALAAQVGGGATLILAGVVLTAVGAAATPHHEIVFAR